MSDRYTNTDMLVDILIRGRAINRITPGMEQIAENNRVLLTLGQKANNLEIIEEGNVWLEKLKKTLIFCNQVLGDEFNWLVTRTFKYSPYVTFDVDVFIPENEFRKAVDKLKKNGCQIKSHDNSLGGRFSGAQVNVIKDGLLTIDLHNDFTWQKRKFLDPKFVIVNSRFQIITGVKVKIPSPEVEFILCMADITHERFNVTLLDLIWIHGLSKEIKKWEDIFQQIKLYKWNRVFTYTAAKINIMLESIYNKQLIPINVSSSKFEYNLPYFLPLKLCWLSYIENFLSSGRFPAVSFAYMHYCKIRYYISGQKQMPYYDKWYKGKLA
jgi:hypothetical protein